jgi:hypothetical protein
MPYSAVTQPLPLLRKNGGTRSSSEAVQKTWVLPNLARQDPSACSAIEGSSEIDRSWSKERPDGRDINNFL